MKHKLCVLILCFSLLCICMSAPASSADGVAQRTASDTMLRTQLRLRDLGYYTGCIDGTSNLETCAALQRFCECNGVAPVDEPPALLFESNTAAAPYERQNDDTLSVGKSITGIALPWDKAKNRLVLDDVYTLTACHSGITFAMRCIGITNHAHITPSQTGDVETLLQLFGSTCDYSKRPVVIRLGTVDVAASLQAYLHNDEAGDADTAYSLYFTDSVSDIGGIPDADHANTVRIAEGGNAR